MIAAHAIGLAILAGTLGVSAGFLAVSRVVASALMLAAGSATIVLWLAMSLPDPAVPITLATLLFAPLAVVIYPRPLGGLNGPDRVAAGAIVAIAVIALAGASAPAPYPVLCVVGVVLIHLWWRFELAGPAVRRPLIWLAIGLGGCAALAFVTAFVLPPSPQVAALLLASLGLPAVCMVIGVRRPDILDATGIVVEAVVLAVSAAACVAGYVMVASVLTLVSGREPGVGIQALIAVAVAAAFNPVRSRLHGAVGELLFGRRPNPLAVVVSLADEPVLDAASILNRIREALVLPYAALHRSDQRGSGATTPLAESGCPTPHLRRFPLVPGGDIEHEALVVGVRPGELRLSRVDCEVLTLVARLLGQVANAEALTAELAQSRAQMRSAVEDERRRLRRDLHDGLGPTLTGIALTADAVTNLTGTGSPDVGALLRQLRAEATAAIDEVRRIVDDIRPPALDQLGLRGALTQAAAGLGRSDVEVVIVVDKELGQVSAAVEVAVYRIVAEALTNAVRHSRPTRIVAELQRTDTMLRVMVYDDGGVPATTWDPGVGLTSMRERAEELGGVLHAGPSAAGGLVEARLPLC